MAKYITHTADDEDAYCMRCDHINSPLAYCIRTCGMEKGWTGYSRTEKVEGEEHERKS